MPVYRLDDRLVFPPVHLAEDGLLALGGDLRPERLILGYTKGIFPWYAENLPILWHSPDPRMVMTTRDLVIQRSLRKQIQRKPYKLTMDTAFEQVLAGCAGTPRPGQHGTWLIPEMVDAYMKLHVLGFAHSIEAWQDGELVGGLYGVSLGAAFFGESMFAQRARRVEDRVRGDRVVSSTRGTSGSSIVRSTPSTSSASARTRCRGSIISRCCATRSTSPPTRHVGVRDRPGDALH